MSNYVEISAKTVEEAIGLAAKELKVDPSLVSVEVLEEGNKGLFGIIGSRLAKYRVSVKKADLADTTRGFLQQIFEKMKVQADIDIQENDDDVVVNIYGEDVGILIGRRGETLDALQFLTSLAVNKNADRHKKVVIDIEDYRQKREEALVQLANRLASKVIKYKKSVTLEPMAPYERRIIHASLQDNKLIETYSLGDEPFRKVVIKLK